MESENFRIPPESKISLAANDSGWVPKWTKKQVEKTGKKVAKEKALTLLSENLRKLVSKQELLWASDSFALLIILQGMDSAGKDSAIRHVMSGVNPQGCQVTSFKSPSEEELDHDFLWRYAKATPERGKIGIFNRSYYEDVLIVKVRPEILEKQKLPPEVKDDSFWEKRYDDINMFERYLVRNGTVIVKFFLNLSKDEQKKRFLNRLEDPEKRWKFSVTDIAERSKWGKYMEAYEEMLNKTSSEWAPWYVIPADKKWVTHALISEVIISQIDKLHLTYPSLSKQQKIALDEARVQLKNE